jgi:hypothetical protein
MPPSPALRLVPHASPRTHAPDGCRTSPVGSIRPHARLPVKPGGARQRDGSAIYHLELNVERVIDALIESARPAMERR